MLYFLERELADSQPVGGATTLYHTVSSFFEGTQTGLWHKWRSKAVNGVRKNLFFKDEICLISWACVRSVIIDQNWSVSLENSN